MSRVKIFFFAAFLFSISLLAFLFLYGKVLSSLFDAAGWDSESGALAIAGHVDMRHLYTSCAPSLRGVC